MGSRIRIDVTRPLVTVLLEGSSGSGSMDAGSWRSLAETFRALSERRDVSAVVVRGTVGGAPVVVAADGDVAGLRGTTRLPEIDEALAAVRACRHPTVAVIEGLCVGADLEIAACCDLRVCGESSRLGAPIERAEGPTDDVDPLEHLLGASPALEALHGGDMMDATRARTFGLVSHVHPDAAVVEHAYRLAASVAAGAPLVNRWHKKMVQRLSERPRSAD
ncbi:MAG: enoyl-CoA hydratase-related protein [Longimicrobiales bacterium]